jgi:hypothetical protein
MQLHALKKEAHKEIHGQGEKVREKESKKHHTEAWLRVRDDLDAGKGDSHGVR